MSWILWIVVFVSPVETQAASLHAYETEAECQSEQKRILAEMVKHYPEQDFILQCQPTQPTEWE